MASNARKVRGNDAQIGTLDWFQLCLERGKNDVFAEVVDINPQLAAEMLKHNDSNRHISKNLVSKLASDIRENRWRLNGEPIILANTGELNDGQHRLSAIIEAAKHAPSFVV